MVAASVLNVVRYITVRTAAASLTRASFRCSTLARSQAAGVSRPGDPQEGPQSHARKPARPRWAGSDPDGCLRRRCWSNPESACPDRRADDCGPGAMASLTTISRSSAVAPRSFCCAGIASGPGGRWSVLPYSAGPTTLAWLFPFSGFIPGSGVAYSRFMIFVLLRIERRELTEGWTARSAFFAIAPRLHRADLRRGQPRVCRISGAVHFRRWRELTVFCGSLVGFARLP